MQGQVLMLPLMFALFAAVALAEAAPTFDQLDKNHDGVLLPDEAEDQLSVEFSEADVNGDGGLSRSEYAAAARLGSGPKQEDAG
jgi:hypothetical protein